MKALAEKPEVERSPMENAAPKPYVPTLADAEAYKAYMTAREKAAPRLKVAPDAPITVDHPNQHLGQMALMKALGSTDDEFVKGLLKQLACAGSEGKKPDEDGINFMLSVVKGIEPRDQVEAMLAAQMAAVHNATMALSHNIAKQDSAQAAFNKLARTFAAQLSALKDYRSKGEQKMTVQHVHVAEGGQAIVGNVNAPTEGVGAKEKIGDQPHALAYAPGEMPRHVQTEREKVPSASRPGV